MGQKWDGFESLEHYQKWVTEWSELMIQRLLYPGAVCLFFGGTRTFHHLGVGLENGGFEIVDSILIPWIHGQGFPKSHDISKGKAAGAEREVIGKAKGAASSETESMGEFKPEYDETAPATPEAEIWDGYGTALKPAWEPVFVCRAPRRGRTFAQLAEEFGTGALNIDGSRINNAILPSERRTSAAGGGRGGMFIPDGSSEPKERHNISGRWPANFVLSHNDDCVKVGEYLVEGRTLNRYPSHGAGGSFAFYSEDHRGEDYDSEETPPDVVERWACVPGCSVRRLDDQVGTLKSGDNAIRTKKAEGVVYGGGVGMEQEPTGEPELAYGDSGGPSRFFYTSKASKREKNKGLENFYWFRGEEGFERVTKEAYQKLDPKKRVRGNIHPTCKPLELLRYLATLLLPPQQEGRTRRILVPFSGSGSEIIAAIQAGWDEVTGIEMMSIYNEVAEARVRGSIGMF